MALSFCRLHYTYRAVRLLRQHYKCLQGNSGQGSNPTVLVHTSACQWNCVEKEKDARLEELDIEIQQLEDMAEKMKLKELKGKPKIMKRKNVGSSTDLHVPVMLDEVLNILGHKSNKMILDMTFGAGGHSKALLDKIPGCHILALDRDPTAHSLAQEIAQERPGQVTPLLGRFSELPTLLEKNNIAENSLDGVLMDLGSSSMQFDQSERGFSISEDGPLDMRMDADRFPDMPTAADVVNSLDEVDLIKIIKKYGEEPRAVKIAHVIVEARSAFGRIRSTQQLAGIVLEICEGGSRRDKLGRYAHPATRTFQALRIFVNNEVNELNFGMSLAHRYLRPGGTCIAISFQSLEDCIVKRHFKEISMDLERNATLSMMRKKDKLNAEPYTTEEVEEITTRKWNLLIKKAAVPTEAEVERNPRSRSAKLRAAEKTFVC